MDTFDVIFTTYSPLVFRYLRSLSGDAAVAEELTAETFYRAYTHFDSFRGDSKLETWLCAIAKNAYLKDCRRSARTVGADALETQPAETDFVERFLDREQAQHMMTKAMANDWGKYNITVNCIAPGYFPTELTEKFIDSDAFVQLHKDRCPKERHGILGEMDGLCVYFAAPCCTYTTGQIVAVDGGWTCN